jgi:4-amino-4-deoxy-L-arabinose transferase-like glycosyltransferase
MSASDKDSVRGRDPFFTLVLLVFSWAALGTVVLSLIGQLNTTGAMLWWSCGGLAGAAIVLRHLRSWGDVSGACKWKLVCLGRDFAGLGWGEKGLWLLLVVVAGCAFLMGAFSPPNNGDSLIYHLPRQLIWIDAGTVFADAMPYAHMAKMPPFAEWIGVQLFLLTGSDRFHFLIQWLSYIACIRVIVQIVRGGGGPRLAALLAAVFFALLPAAFYQASNTKNDVLLAMILLGICSLAQRIFHQNQFRAVEGLEGGALAGLAVLSKGTAFAYLPVIGVAFAIPLVAKMLKGYLKPAFGASVVTILAFVLIAGIHYAFSFGDIVGTESGSKSHHANASIHPATGVSVFLRNYSLQLALPLEGWNRSLEAGAERLGSIVGVPRSDPDSTFYGAEFAVVHLPFWEDSATGFPQFLLGVILLIFSCCVLWRGDLGEQKALILYSVVLFFASIALFSLLFRWQPWHGRLLIPAVAMLAPGVGIFLGRFRSPWLPLTAVFLLTAWWVPGLFSWSRPLLGSLMVFHMTEEVAIGRAGSGAVFLPAFGKSLREAGVGNLWLDLQNGVVHAALRELPGGTRFTYPGSAPLDSEPEAVLTNLAPELRHPQTRLLMEDMVLFSSMEGWELYLAPGKADKLLEDREGEHLPPMVQVAAVRGIGPWEGPYPQWGMGRFASVEPS